MNYLKNASLGKKIALICAVSVLAVFLAGSIITSFYLGDKIYKESIAELSAKTKIIISMMEVLDESTKVSADRMSSLFIHDVAGTAVVNASNTIKIGAAETPEMRIGGKIVNLNTDIVDRFTKNTGGTVATIFARKGDEFYRITTSLKKEDGTRAMGTALDHSHPAYQILLGGGTYLGQAMLFGKYYMTKYTPIKDAAGKTIGSYFVGVDINSEMNKMITAIKSLKIGETGYFFAINGKGDMKIHPSLEGKNFLDLKDADGKEIIKDIIARKSGAISYNWKDAGATLSHGKTTVFDYCKDWDWYVCGSTYDSELKAGATRARNALILLALLGSIIVSAIIYVAVSRRLAGLKDLSEKIQAISKGNLAVKIEARSNDEVGQISSDMAEMTTHLRSMIADIKIVSDSVASGSEQLNTNSDEISQTLSGQSAKAQQIATATEEMSQTVMDIAKNTSDIASAANDSWVKAKEGVQVVDKSVSESRAIADTVNDSAAVIQTLGEKSKQIGEILGVIKDIADQTNLLALNAAIEAARAGEQGRGFSVVADEVRKLAEKTAGATTEIGEMIQSIQSEVDAAVLSMHKTSEQVQIGLRYSVKAGEQLESIVGSIVQLQGMAQQIATATEEMSSTSESISSDLQGVAGASTDISGGSKQIASSSSELAMHAGKLKEIVENFKV